MALPYFQAKSNSRTQLKVFAGLDRRDKIADSSLTEMTNMSGDAIPSLMPREARKYIASAPGACSLCAPEYTGGELTAFTGVAGKYFYYKGTKIKGELTDGKKAVADFNGKICIFPDKVYYDYLPSPETGEISDSLTSMEKIMQVKNLNFYSSHNNTTDTYTSYISASNVDFSKNFSVGDSIVISGCQNTKNNTKTVSGRKDYASENDIVSMVVDSVSTNKITLLMYNKKGQRAEFTNGTESGTVTIKVSVPDMDNICVHNNRLWGTATSGECIYASRLGDCTSFYSYQGLGDDSWYGMVGTGGEFTGICSYRTAVVAFKRECIHHIYGDAPVNFAMPKQTAGGCIDGRSICEIGGVLYYLSNDGFKGYSGGEPFGIAPQLKGEYTSCVSGSDGRHYYCSAQGKDGKTDVLVYTPDTGIWVREDDTVFEGFCSYNGSLYGIADGEMWRMNGGDEPTSWCVVSKRFTYDMIENKGLSCIWLRMDMEENSSVNVYLSFDGGDFIKYGEISHSGFSTHCVPVRFGKCNSFRVMVEGCGKVVIHDIEITSHNGGRTY